MTTDDNKQQQIDEDKQTQEGRLYIYPGKGIYIAFVFPFVFPFPSWGKGKTKIKGESWLRFASINRDSLKDKYNRYL